MYSLIISPIFLLKYLFDFFPRTHAKNVAFEPLSCVFALYNSASIEDLLDPNLRRSLVSSFSQLEPELRAMKRSNGGDYDLRFTKSYLLDAPTL